MNELSSKTRTLLDAARSARPSPATRDRLNAALAVQLGMPIGAPPSAAPAVPVAPAPLAGASAAASMAKAVAIGIALGVATIGGAAAWPTRSPTPIGAQSSVVISSPSSRALAAPIAPPPAVVEASSSSSLAPIASPPSEPLPRAALPSAVVATAVSGGRVAPPDEVPSIAVNAPPAPPPQAISIGEETALLREAQRSLKQGDGARALAVLDDLAARHPAGVLREERLAARVFALCAAGQTDAARAAGQRFLAEMPASVQAERVRASCASSPVIPHEQ